MFRIRRYRLFLIFASITVIALYQFTNVRDWEATAPLDVGNLRPFGGKHQVAPGSKAGDGKEGEKKPSDAQPNVEPVPLPKVKVYSSTTKLPPPPKATPGTPPNDDPSFHLDEIKHEQGKGRLEAPDLKGDLPTIHWKPMKEHFPVPPGSIIPLPTGTANDIPKIQFKFKKEKAKTKADREAKAKSIKDAFLHSWRGYTKNAWRQDELKPVSGGFGNPYSGWGATLVDSLDTLWMMGMYDEFEEALIAVRKIDFTTTKRIDIPVFETTIRYLGGLLGAYDVSGRNRTMLLEKAVELADVLMGAFDTPNRMPTMYYLWKPTFASQPHRAGPRVVLAEIGSLSVEFTRLAQLTNENKYYDAVARITNEFDLWQNNTGLPGLWPLSVDTSGCTKHAYSSPLGQQVLTSADETQPEQTVASTGSQPGVVDPSTQQGSVTTGNEKVEAPANPQASAPAGAPAGEVKAADSSTSQSSAGQANAQEVTTGQTADGQAVPAVPAVPAAQAGQVGQVGQTDQASEAGQAGQISTEQTEKKQDDSNFVQGIPDKAKIKGWGETSTDTSPKAESPGKVQKRQLNDAAAALGGAQNQGTSSNAVPVAGEKTETQNQAAKQDASTGTQNVSNGNQNNGKSEQDVTSAATGEGIPGQMHCEPQGLASPQGTSSETFSIGGMADSVYEYLPKEFLLLGGLRSQYRDMYERAVTTADKYLFFRPMNPRNRDVLLSGALSVHKREGSADDVFLEPEGAHLTCFAGGMLALGGKIFGRKNDVDLGAKLTEGCVWAYESTQTGIMPESFRALPCEDRANCKWDETAYYDALDPYKDGRENLRKERKEQLAGSGSGGGSSSSTSNSQAQAQPGAASRKRAKRQAVAPADVSNPGAQAANNAVVNAAAQPNQPAAPAEVKAPEADKMTTGSVPASDTQNNNQVTTGSYVPPEPPTHQEYVENRIKEERLPGGFLRIPGRSYGLRPEAIESVFIMYRITGDESWREKGWNMFTAIQNFTRTELGNSAIDDVTKETPEMKDEMESFWLGETLKYFYLLFSDPEDVSLDDYVFNTEAHPFKLPKPEPAAS